MHAAGYRPDPLQQRQVIEPVRESKCPLIRQAWQLLKRILNLLRRLRSVNVPRMYCRRLPAGAGVLQARALISWFTHECNWPAPRLYPCHALGARRLHKYAGLGRMISPRTNALRESVLPERQPH